MAIDTREKRQSVSALALQWIVPSVTPNSAKDQEWRQESGWSYPGILAASPSAAHFGALVNGPLIKSKVRTLVE